ncbi:ribose transport system substrate-binding protein [Palleronia aestuarii]|uniref:Ribose transport system substrate-binding protein n=1 Tax=Palleronia aestuarii TaxID=568105 RepID=A0A2W7MX23_9RHOB|nr:substrate-binding domain-containing protein [Palleronia aestuarii]PZX12191.1 ribose transport system substrate-binding protein [Palleronia aestuarii]
MPTIQTAVRLGATTALGLAVSATTLLAQDDGQRTYIYASQLQGHPYLLDSLLGMDYAEEKFGVTVEPIGPQGWDPVAGAESVEQAIAREPDGIITTLWEPGALPGIARAMEQGIPVVVIEATVPDSGALTFIGLDNYEAGVDTARELIARGGNSGTYVASGNWGASNTDAKFQGLTEYLDANSGWELAGRIDDQATTSTAIDAAKTMFNTYPDITAVIGLDSSSGTGICLAAEELDRDIEDLVVIVHDREDPVLECIEYGAIDATIVNKTALQAYMAVQMLEAYNDAETGLAEVPISASNEEAGVTPFPAAIYMGTEVIDAENVEDFMRSNLPEYE